MQYVAHGIRSVSARSLITYPDFARVAAHITVENVRDLLADLVNIPSPTGKEIGVAHYLVARMGRSGLTTNLPLVDKAGRMPSLICCRSTRTSASSAARDRTRSTTRPSSNLMRSDIWHSVARFSTSCQPGSIYDRDTRSEGLAQPIQMAAATAHMPRSMSSGCPSFLMQFTAPHQALSDVSRLQRRAFGR